MLFISRNVWTRNSNHTGHIRRTERLPRRPAAGLNVQARDRTGSLAAISNKQHVSVFGPAQRHIGGLRTAHQLRFAAVYRNQSDPIAGDSGYKFAVGRNRAGIRAQAKSFGSYGARLPT